MKNHNLNLNIKSELLKKGDSLFVDKNLSIYAYERLYSAIYRGFINGHVQAGSSKLNPTFAKSKSRIFLQKKKHIYWDVSKSMGFR